MPPTKLRAAASSLVLAATFWLAWIPPAAAYADPTAAATMLQSLYVLGVGALTSALLLPGRWLAALRHSPAKGGEQAGDLER